MPPHFFRNQRYVAGQISSPPGPGKDPMERTQVSSFIRRFAISAVAALSVFGIVVTASPLALAQPAPDSFADLSARLSPAVVNVSTTQELKRPKMEDMPQLPEGSPFEEFFKRYFEQQGPGDGRPQRVTSLGSGFVIDPSGIIVTNNHVIEDADQIEVTFPDGTKLPATVIGRDKKTDIAVLQVKPNNPLPALQFGDSRNLRVGDWVLAIGNPFGLGGTVTAGIVSARNRDINAGPYDDFIQTDAAINRGNSGGPLFDMNGMVVGVNTAIITPSGGSIGIGFAVPSEIVISVVQQLREYGETRRGWIGVRIQTVTSEIAEGLNLEHAAGALVAEVTKDGPAAKAGIQAGDLITQFDGRDVPDMRALPRMVAETEIGKTISVTVQRKGETRTFDIVIGKLDEHEDVLAENQPDDPNVLTGAPAGHEVATLGMTLATLNDQLRRQYGIAAEVKGVVVTSIKGGSPAGFAQDENRIREGDVIVEVQQEQVNSPEEVETRVKSVVDAKGKVVLLLLNRAGELSFAALRLDQS